MSNEQRRKLLKSIAAGGGAVIAGKSLPDTWHRPVVDAVLLPVHGQTSVTSYAGSTTQQDVPIASIGRDSMFAGAVGTLMPEAHAGPPPPPVTADVTYEHCIEPNADLTAADCVTVVTWVRSDGCSYNARYSLDNVPVEAAGSLKSMNADWLPCIGGDNGFIKLTAMGDQVIGRFECGCGGLISDFTLGFMPCAAAASQLCDNCPR